MRSLHGYNVSFLVEAHLRHAFFDPISAEGDPVVVPWVVPVGLIVNPVAGVDQERLILVDGIGCSFDRVETLAISDEMQQVSGTNGRSVRVSRTAVFPSAVIDMIFINPDVSGIAVRCFGSSSELTRTILPDSR